MNKVLLPAALAVFVTVRVSAQQTLPVIAPAASALRMNFLTVSGAVQTPLSLNVEDLAKMPRASAKVGEDGAEVMYEGVLLSEILKRAGAPGGSTLRGKALASYLLCEAKDGYRVVFALAEFDPDFNDNPILVADRRDGKPLFDYQGPLRLIAPRDKRAARGVRMLTKLTVVTLPE